MASKYPSPPASPHSLDDLLTCPVCLDSFKDPRTLSCLHSFCTPCLEQCRRPYRRDLACPVCKKVTQLTPMGITGLQNDFRIQQIRDILLTKSPVTSDDEGAGSSGPDQAQGKSCDLCKSEHKNTPALTHCIQCFMYFCEGCTTKHNNNGLFNDHHVIVIGEKSRASEVLFCRNHKEHPVRYFCKPCSAMFCTICVMNHDSSHAPEPLEKGIIEKYRKELTKSLRTVKSKLNEVKSQTKYLETVKETHQQAQYEAQTAIKEKTEELISQIREQEKQLLQQVQNKMEERMIEIGLDSLGEMRFHKTNMEQLYHEMCKVVKGSPQDCLVAYEDLIGRFRNMSERSLPNVPKAKLNCMVKFVPAVDDLRIVLGSLKECTINDEESDMDTTQASPSHSFSVDTKATSPKPRRVKSILNALSPGRQQDLKMSKVKSSSSAERPKSPSRKINADELLASTSPQPLSVATVATTSADNSVSIVPQLVFKVDEVGGWPGKIASPSSLAFLSNGQVIVAEAENRLQVFDMTGKSTRIIGWGKVKPYGVAVMNDGKIAITDQKDHCIKIFSQEGECIVAWGNGNFRSPAGIAALSNGNLVITDTERHTVNIHRPDGAQVTQFGSWGNGDYQFNNVNYVAADKDDNIYVVDGSNSYIKIYSSMGVFIKKVSLLGASTKQLWRPQGMCVTPQGNMIVADRDNHRVTLLSPDGQFIRHVLSKSDGVKYPSDVVYKDGVVGVVETYAGFLSKDPHHAIKIYKLPDSYTSN